MDQEIDGVEEGHEEMQINGNVPLYPNSPVTLGESMHMVLTLALNHHLSGKCIGDLLQMISVHCVEPNNCLSSLYMFKKFFANAAMPLRRCYYCTACHGPLEGPADICHICEANRGISYFISVPIVPQILTLFKREGFYAKLQHRFQRVKVNENNIEDVYDGQLYRRYCGDGGFLADVNAISFCWNSDGVPVFKSSKYAIWPFFLRINELPYQDRVRKDNIILAGLWFGPKKPFPNLFLLPLLNDLRVLRNGVQVEIPGQLNPVVIKAMVLNGTCDMPAKALFLNFKSYNGYYGCTACTHRGERTPDNRHFYRYHVDIHPRTEEETEENVAMATQLGEPVYGVKGVSILSRIVPDYVNSTAIDPMHKYSGILMKIIEIWFAEYYHEHPASIREHLRLVNQRLLDIKPLIWVERLPRSLEHLKYWKISELKLFLFCYAIPILHDLLSPIIFNHFLLLVCGLYLLNQPSISPQNLRLASSLLREFVAQFEDIYGLEHMTCNVHQLLHLGPFVRNLGPLFASSCAPFETMNGVLKKYVHGTRYADLQVCTAASLYLGMAVFKERDLREEGPVQEFCKRLSNRQKRLRLTHITPIISAADALTIMFPIPHEINQALLNVNVNAHRLHKFQKVFYKKRLFVSKAYTRTKKTISYCVKFSQGGLIRLGLIEQFLRVSNCDCIYLCECPAQCYAIVTLLESENRFSTNAPACVVSFVYECEITNIQLAVAVEDFISQCFYITIEDLHKIFVVEPVNNLENDD